MRVSILGCGNIGSLIAEHLIAAGHSVSVWNRSPKPIKALVKKGAREVSTASEAFTNDVVLSVLFDDKAVQDVLFPHGNLIGHPGLHMCLSTISVDMVHRLTDLHKQAKVAYVSSPFFGRPEAAKEKKLHFLVAGEKSDVDRAEPILKVLGTPWRIGTDPLAANLGKMAGNFMIGGLVEAMAEAAALLRAAKVDTAPLFTMLGDTLLSAPVFKNYSSAFNPEVPSNRSLGLDLPIKDLEAILEAARQFGLKLPIAELNLNTLKEAKTLGFGNEDGAVARAKMAERRRQ